MVKHYERYEEAVSSLLSEARNIQYLGDRDKANEFVEKQTRWGVNLHGVIASAMQDAETSRFRLVRYEVPGE